MSCYLVYLRQRSKISKQLSSIEAHYEDITMFMLLHRQSKEVCSEISLTEHIKTARLHSQTHICLWSSEIENDQGS